MFSFFKGLLHPAEAAPALRGPATPRSPECEPIADHLARDVQTLDTTSPGWREDSRGANAKLRIERGMPHALAVATFGATTAEEALRQLRSGASDSTHRN